MSSTYKVKKGDTLWAISKKTGVHIDDLVSYNSNIKDINKIQIGDEIRTEPPVVQSNPVDYREQRRFEQELNKSGKNEDIIKYIQHDKNYAIIDKKKKVIEVFSPENELIYSGKIGTGKSGDDYNTITYTKDGKIINFKGNNSTPAGITMVSGTGTYHGVPSFTRARYNKKTGKWDDNIASSMHFRSSDGSNGCIGLLGDTANELSQYIKPGTMVYTLPEKPGSRFMVRDGLLSFIADDPYGKDDKDDPKRFWDDYNTFVDKSYKPVGINPLNSDIDVNVNEASMFSSVTNLAKKALYSLVNTGDKEVNKGAYIKGIEDFKKSIMMDTGIDSSIYNDLAELALGISEQESKFGTSLRYVGKNAIPDEALDVAKKARNFIQGKKDSPISYRSRGMTQIKIQGDNKETQTLYDKYGIDEDSLENPYMAAAATMIRLANIYRGEVAGKKFGDISPMDAVLYKWSGRNKLLRSGKANPESDEYLQNVKKYASQFEIKTVDKYDERAGNVLAGDSTEQIGGGMK